MTDKQKRIYNMHLQAASLAVGHPFRMRKDFDGFEDEQPEDYAAILKLEKLFKVVTVNDVAFNSEGIVFGMSLKN